jgi:hypothetical protein
MPTVAEHLADRIAALENRARDALRVLRRLNDGDVDLSIFREDG